MAAHAQLSDRPPATTAVGAALGAGVCGAVQPKLNAVLGERVGSSLVASLVNFGVALACVVVALAVRPATRARLRDLRSWPVPRWTLTAGFGGAVVVLSGAVAVETIGVAVFSVAFFAGQLTAGLVVDGLGIGAGGRRPITAVRVQSVVLAIVAVVVAQVGRPVGELAPGLVVFVVAAGAAAAVQSAFNGRIAAATGDAVTATSVNVAVGTVALAAVVAGLAAADRLDAPDWPSEPWLYAGGSLGVTVVLTIALAAAAVGVLRATLAMLAAQLVAAFIVDWMLGDQPTAGVFVGGALIVGAAVLVGRSTA